MLPFLVLKSGSKTTTAQPVAVCIASFHVNLQASELQATASDFHFPAYDCNHVRTTCTTFRTLRSPAVRRVRDRLKHYIGSALSSRDSECRKKTARTADLFDVAVEHDVELEAVVRPRTELEVADLDVERKLGDVDGAGAAEDRRRNPEHGPVGRDDRHRLAVFLQARVGTAARQIRK